jgi:hypothetical protein
MRKTRFHSLLVTVPSFPALFLWSLRVSIIDFLLNCYRMDPLLYIDAEFGNKLFVWKFTANPRSRNRPVSRPLPGSLYFLSRKVNNDIIIITCMSVYRRSLDWWLDLLTTYTLTTHYYTLQITDTHRLVYSACYVSTRRFLATDFNTGTATVSLNYTFKMSYKFFSSQPDFQISTFANNSFPKLSRL